MLRCTYAVSFIVHPNQGGAPCNTHVGVAVVVDILQPCRCQEDVLGGGYLYSEVIGLVVLAAMRKGAHVVTGRKGNTCVQCFVLRGCTCARFCPCRFLWHIDGYNCADMVTIPSHSLMVNNNLLDNVFSII